MGYSGLGLVFGIYGAVVFLLSQSNALKKLLFAPLLVGNIAFFVLNTWITVNGMGIPFGSQFHLALAAILRPIAFWPVARFAVLQAVSSVRKFLSVLLMFIR